MNVERSFSIFIVFTCMIYNLYSQQMNEIRTPTDKQLDSLCLQCGEHLKWKRLESGYYKEYPDTYHQQISKLEIVNQSLYDVLDKYVINNDTFYNTSFYLLNMCALSDSVSVLAVSSIYDPSDVADCRGYIIYKSACFFIQYGLEDFTKPTSVVKDFYMEKYPQVYVDSDLPTEYFVVNNYFFTQYYPTWIKNSD